MLRNMLFASLWLQGLGSSAIGAPIATPPGWPYPLQGQPVRAVHAMVSTASPIASKIGIDILKKGGNAVDAAVAIGFGMAVTWPGAGNIGGGGMMLIRDAKGTIRGLDYRPTAPAKATPDMYSAPQYQQGESSLHGHLSVATPGTVRGLWEAHRRMGRLRWAEVVKPAIEVARKGFIIDAALARSFKKREAFIRRNPEAARIYLVDGRARLAGSRFVQPQLAQTLRLIAEKGPDGFYKGPVAKAIAAEMARHNGILSKQDLAGYQAKWRVPISCRYRGYKVVTLPPPSAGGLVLLESLQMLANDDLKSLGYHSAAMLHLISEVERRAYADRNAYVGDPAFISNPTSRLLDPAYARQRRATIDPLRATPDYSNLPGLPDPADTTHFVVVDRDGNAVSNTYSLNDNFGSGVVAPGTGFFLNGEMDNFTTKPGVPNFYGLVQGGLNAIAPGKRMVSSNTPTMVLRPTGQLMLALGTPGGPRIPTTILQIIVNMLDFGMSIRGAISAPRFHHQGHPDQILVERDGFEPDVLKTLEGMGHSIQVASFPIGDVKAVAVTPNRVLEGWADPRRGGATIGY